MKTSQAIALCLMLGCYPYPNDSEARWCAEHTCYWEPLTYSAHADDAQTVSAALDILRAATGADFRLGEFGIPVGFEPGTPGGCTEDDTACGCVVLRYDLPSLDKVSQDIYVSSDLERCGDPVRSLLHEMVHTLVPVDVDHSQDGVFAEHSSDDMRLRGESLDILCAAMVCPARVDEL